MDFKKTKKGYYRTSFTVIDTSGKKKRFELYAKDPDELQRKYIEKKLEYEKGLLVVNSKSTVEKWALEWLETYKKGKVRVGTYKDYEQKVNNTVIPAIGALQLCDVKHFNLQRILNKLTCSKSNGRKIKNTIEQIFKTATINGLIATNPAIGLELPKLEEGQRRSLTVEEREVILKVAQNHRAGLWVKIMLYCGLRPSEAIVLDWNRDIDTKTALINVSKALDIKTGKIKEPKTNAGYRSVPIPNILLKELSRKKGIGLVFAQQKTGNHHTASSMRRMWESFIRQVDIELGAELYRNKIVVSKVAKDLTPYCLRHTYCTDLQDAGVPINVAKVLMGHSDISVTANIYTHHTEKAAQNALETINKFHAV